MNHEKMQQTESSNIRLVWQDNKSETDKFNSLVYHVVDSSKNNQMIGYAVDCDYLFDDIKCGCVLIDKKTNKCFAVIVENYWDYWNERNKRVMTNDIVACNYTYDMQDFQLKLLSKSEQTKRNVSPLKDTFAQLCKKFKLN